MVRDFRLLLKATFHWKYANWAIALAGGGALTAALSAKFTLAYGFTFLTALYSIGCWLTSDTLEMKRHPGKYIYQPNNRYTEVPNPAFVWWRAIPTCLMLLAFAAPMFYIRSLQINKDLESLDGWLYPMSDIINGSCQPDHPTTGVMIEVGTNIIEADQFPYSVISVNCGSVLSIDRDKSRRIGITATVRDREGRVVCGHRPR
jgi:hypothetical protein